MNYCNSIVSLRGAITRRLEGDVTVLAHSHRSSDAQLHDLRLVATAARAEDETAVPAVVSSLREAEPDAALGARVDRVVAQPMVGHGAPRRVGHAPRMHSPSCVTHQNSPVVPASNQPIRISSFTQMSLFLL